MFDVLITLEQRDIDAIADTLQRFDPVALRVDPRPAFVILVPATKQGRPYEVDFTAVENDMTTPLPMTFPQYMRLTKWLNTVIPRVCKTWKERYPEH